MQLFFRELILEDLPAVNNLCKDIWKDENGVSEDYLPKIIKSWILEENSTTFGAFKDEQKSLLIALGRVKIMSKDYAWAEGGRVAEEYQRAGIGKILGQKSIDYAKSKNVKYIQYDTFTENLGSVSIAKALGYYQKDYMELLEGELVNISLDNLKSVPFKEISPEEAFKFLREIPNGPATEISAGWSYKPFNLQQISKIKGKWIRNDEAIVLKIGSDVELEEKTPYLMKYG